MTWGAVAGAAVGVVGSALTSHNAGNSARAGANQGSALDQARWNELQNIQHPYTTSGNWGVQNLDFRLGLGPGSGHQGYGGLMTPYGQKTPGPFQYTGQQAPGAFNPTAYKPFTLQDFYNTSPAYKFQKEQGMQGVLNGSASGAGALSGAAQKDLMGFNQGLANTAWGNAFNQNMAGQQQRYQQQLGQYEGQLQGYNSQFGNQLGAYGENLAQQQQGFGQYNTQQNNIYARLMGLSGMGQQSAGQLTSAGAGLGMDQAQGYSNAGAAAAWGQMGTGNALAGGAMYLGANLPWDKIGQSWNGSPQTQLPSDTAPMPISSLPNG